jgi:plasma kallikrein
VFLKTEVKLAENINTICLPPQDFVFTGSKCYVTGWGKNLFGANANDAILKKIDVPAVDFLKCQDALRKHRQGPDFTLHSR